MVLDPVCECNRVLGEKGASFLVQQSLAIEQVAGIPDIRLRLLHHRHVEKHKCLAQRLISRRKAPN